MTKCGSLYGSTCQDLDTDLNVSLTAELKVPVGHADDEGRGDMEFRIAKTEFLRGLRLAQGIADRKSTMPMLANVLLRFSFPIEVPSEELTFRTVSLAMDIVWEASETASVTRPLNTYAAAGQRSPDKSRPSVSPSLSA